MNRPVVFLTLMLLTAACAKAAEVTETGFKLRWDYYRINGVDEVYALDSDSDGVPEVYACSYESTRPTIWALDENGGLLYEIPVPRPGLVDFGNERVVLMRPADLDLDGNLDVLSASEIISSGVNSHRLYRFERSFQGDLERYRTAMGWMEIRTGFVTGIVLAWQDGRQRVYTSSTDFMVRSFDVDGNLLWNASLGSSVWDLHTVYFGVNETGLAAATFRGIYLVGCNRSVLWNYSSGGRFSRTYAADVDNDSVDEVFALSGDVLYRFALDGTLLWNRTVGESNANIISADFNNDGLKEVIVSSGQYILGLNPDGEVSWKLDVKEKPRHIEACNLSDDGTQSLIAATPKGLKAFDAGAGVEVEPEDGALMLGRAREQFSAGNRSSALAHTERARDAFAAVGDMDSTAECDRILDLIKVASTADQHYENALSYAETGFNQEAVSETELAAALYHKAGLAGELNMTLYLNRSLYERLYSKGNITLADYFYGMAESHYVESDFKAAAEYAMNASVYYRSAGDSAGLGRSEALIKAAAGRETATTTTLGRPVVIRQAEGVDYSDYLLGGGVILLFFIAVAAIVSAVRGRG